MGPSDILWKLFVLTITCLQLMKGASIEGNGDVTRVTENTPISLVKRSLSRDRLDDDVVHVELGVANKHVRLRLVRDESVNLDTPVFVENERGLEPAPEHDMPESGLFHDKRYFANMAVTQTPGGKELHGTLWVDGREYGVEPVEGESGQGVRGEAGGVLHTVKALPASSKVDMGANQEQHLKRRKREAKWDPMFEKEIEFIESLLRRRRASEKADDGVAKETGSTYSGLFKRAKSTTSDGIIHYVIETTHIFDNTMWKHWLVRKGGDEVAAVKALKLVRTQACLTMKRAYANINSEEYKISITPIIKRFIIVKSELSSLHRLFLKARFTEHGEQQLDFAMMTDSVGKWNKEKGFNYTNPDVTVWWTRLQGRARNRTLYVLGLASQLCGICMPELNVALVMEAGLNSWRTAAHELAHLLGSDHDGEENTEGSSCREQDGYIMGADAGGDSPNHHRLSSCTTMMIKNCLAGHDNKVTGVNYPRVCLLNRVCNITERIVTPGLTFSLDQQCDLLYRSATFCGDANSPRVCQRLTCCTTDGTPIPDESLEALDGTQCGSATKWCRSGECVTRESVTPSSGTTCLGQGISTDVPKGCRDKFKDCKQLPIDEPFYCFVEPERTGCCATCHRAGLVDPAPSTNSSELDPAPSGGQWQAWGPWSSCTLTCGQGRRTRTRHCPAGMDCSPGSATKSASCNPKPCPRECPADEWACGSSAQAQCVPYAWVCDGYRDCRNGADERDCSTDYYDYKIGKKASGA